MSAETNNKTESLQNRGTRTLRRWPQFMAQTVIILCVVAIVSIVAEGQTGTAQANPAQAAAAPCITPTITATPTNTATPTPTNTPTNTPSPTPDLTATFNAGVPAPKGTPAVKGNSVPKNTPAFRTNAAPTDPCGTTVATGEINGTIALDGGPAIGFGVRLEGRETAQFTTGIDGRYRFTNLPVGSYVVRVVYDTKKYKPVGQDFSDQALGEGTVSSRNFDFVTIVVPKPPTPTTTSGGNPIKVFNPTLSITPDKGLPGTPVLVTGEGWNPQGPDGGPNQVTVALDNVVSSNASGTFNGRLAAPITLGTFPVTSDGKLQAQTTLPQNLAAGQIKVLGTDRNNQNAQQPFTVQPQQPNVICPNNPPPSGNGLRIAFKTTQVNQDFAICVQVVAGSFDVDLSHTVVVTLPPGSTVKSTSPSTGTVSTSGTTASWGGFTLPARASATLILQVNSTSSNLDKASVVVTGRTSTGINFRRVIPGLPPLTEIDFGPNPANIAAAPPLVPSTGNGQDEAGMVSVLVLLALSLIATGAVVAGGALGWKWLSQERRR